MKKTRFLALFLLFALLPLNSCIEQPFGNRRIEAAQSTLFTAQVTSETTDKTIPADKKGEREDYMPLQYDFVKAMWISQFDLSALLTENGKQRTAQTVRSLADTMMKNTASLGINTVFIQVRPNADSFYPSEYFPPSRFAVGKYGQDFSYDPFEILIAAAKKQGFSVHAWINPLRCMTPAEIKLIDRKYEVARWYDSPSLSGKYIVEVGGVLYLNPAYAPVRTLVAQGAAEILKKYQVDGIHIDDYFYPTQSASFDETAYSEYKSAGGTLALADFRRSQTNLLVAKLYAATKTRGSGYLFGVSPGGNTARNINQLYADVASWCRGDGYVDYICPQVYFGFEHQSFPFDKVCDEFAEMANAGKVKLIIGMTLSKAHDGYDNISDPYAGQGGREWIENRDILSRSLNYVRSLEDCGGVAFFTYRLFFDVLSGKPVHKTADETQNFLPVLKEMN